MNKKSKVKNLLLSINNQSLQIKNIINKKNLLENYFWEINNYKGTQK